MPRGLYKTFVRSNTLRHDLGLLSSRDIYLMFIKEGILNTYIHTLCSSIRVHVKPQISNLQVRLIKQMPLKVILRYLGSCKASSL